MSIETTEKQRKNPLPHPSLLNLEKFIEYTKGDANDFHEQRRIAMLKRYGKEIRELYGPTWWIKYYVIALVIAQLALSVWVPKQSWLIYFLVSWIVGGTITHILTLAIHEVTHFNAFESVILNWGLAFIADLPIPVATAATFKQYHKDHHGYMGVKEYDTDIPTEFEAKLYSSVLGKLFHVTFQSLIYSLRPVFLKAQPITRHVIANWIFQLGFNYVWYTFFGWKPFVYLFVCLFLGLGPNPLGLGGHYISEHFVTRPEQDTYSYYGPLNLIAFNVGLHTQHHDFQNLSCGKLPKLQEIAPEFYEGRFFYTSWLRVLYDYIFTDGYTGWNRKQVNQDHDLLKYRRGKVE